MPLIRILLVLGRAYILSRAPSLSLCILSRNPEKEEREGGTIRRAGFLFSPPQKVSRIRGEAMRETDGDGDETRIFRFYGICVRSWKNLLHARIRSLAELELVNSHREINVISPAMRKIVSYFVKRPLLCYVLDKERARTRIRAVRFLILSIIYSIV